MDATTQTRALNGLQLAEAVCNLRPTLPIMLLTGYIGEIPVSVLRAAGIRKVLPKPATAEEIVDASRELLS